MHYFIIPKLKIIVGWNPKVACTTIKSLLLNKLGYDIEGNIHLDMLNKANVESGKYDIYMIWKTLYLKTLIIHIIQKFALFAIHMKD